MGYAECKHGKYCGYDCCVPDLCNEFEPVEETDEELKKPVED